jgi:hypothetical protein
MLHRSDQKMVDEVKRIRGALERGEYSLTEDEKNAILECAKELGMDGTKRC